MCVGYVVTFAAIDPHFLASLKASFLPTLIYSKYGSHALVVTGRGSCLMCFEFKSWH